MLSLAIVWLVLCGFLRLRILIGIFDMQSIVCWLNMTIGSRTCLFLCPSRILSCNWPIACISMSEASKKGAGFTYFSVSLLGIFSAEIELTDALAPFCLT